MSEGSVEKEKSDISSSGMSSSILVTNEKSLTGQTRNGPQQEKQEEGINKSAAAAAAAGREGGGEGRVSSLSPSEKEKLPPATSTPSSPQPPRVLTAQDRKRMILLRRRSSEKMMMTMPSNDGAFFGANAAAIEKSGERSCKRSIPFDHVSDGRGQEENNFLSSSYFLNSGSKSKKRTRTQTASSIPILGGDDDHDQQGSARHKNSPNENEDDSLLKEVKSLTRNDSTTTTATVIDASDMSCAKSNNDSIWDGAINSKSNNDRGSYSRSSSSRQCNKSLFADLAVKPSPAGSIVFGGKARTGKAGLLRRSRSLPVRGRFSMGTMGGAVGNIPWQSGTQGGGVADVNGKDGGKGSSEESASNAGDVTRSQKNKTNQTNNHSTTARQQHAGGITNVDRGRMNLLSAGGGQGLSPPQPMSSFALRSSPSLFGAVMKRTGTPGSSKVAPPRSDSSDVATSTAAAISTSAISLSGESSLVATTTTISAKDFRKRKTAACSSSSFVANDICISSSLLRPQDGETAEVSASAIGVPPPSTGTTPSHPPAGSGDLIAATTSCSTPSRVLRDGMTTPVPCDREGGKGEDGEGNSNSRLSSKSFGSSGTAGGGAGGGSNLSTASPGGCALLRVLDSVTNPFYFDDDDDEDEDAESEKDRATDGDVESNRKKDDIAGEEGGSKIKSSSNLDGNSAESGGSSNKGLDDWHEVSLRVPTFLLTDNDGGIDNKCGGVEDIGTSASHRSAQSNHVMGSPPAYKASNGGSHLRTDCDGMLSVYDAPTQATSTSNRNAPRSQPGWPLLSQPGMSAGVIDWSIKRRFRIECHPGHCVPGMSFANDDVSGEFGNSMISDEGRVERMALDMFMGVTTTDRVAQNRSKSIPPEEIVMAKWKAALMYWQHPAVHPLPASILAAAATTASGGDNSSGDGRGRLRRLGSGIAGGRIKNPESSSLGDKKKSKRLMSEEDRDRRMKLSSVASSELLHAVRGPHASLHHRVRLAGRGSLGGLGHSYGNSASTLAKLVEQREHEWQNSFRSMFFAWLRQLDDVREALRWGGGESAVGCASRNCFYALSPGQVVLFRAVLRRTQNNSTSFDHPSSAHDGSTGPDSTVESKHNRENECPIAVVPAIIMSSTTSQLRTKLRSMGAKLKIFGRKTGELDDDEEFCERLVQQPVSNAGEAEDEEAAIVRKELEALRRAVAMGENAGAEISVSMIQRARTGETKYCHPRSLPPIYVSGNEDCMAFFELYFNTTGRIMNDSPRQMEGTTSMAQQDKMTPADVPLLLTRSVGPFLHASLRYLSVSSRRDEYQWQLQAPSKDNFSSKGDNHLEHSSIELRGPILPSAVQDILCASGSYLLLDKKRKKQELIVDATGSKVESKLNLCANHPASSEFKASSDCSGQKSDSDEAIGSHFFVVHMQTSEGEESFVGPKDAVDVTGCPSTAWFNGHGVNGQKYQHCKKDEIICKDDNNLKVAGTVTDMSCIRECSHGEVMCMAVWDVTRPAVVLYKTELASSVIPHSNQHDLKRSVSSATKIY